MTIRLGDTVRDAITKLEGVVTARHEYLYGCTRLSVQPAEHKDGKMPEPFAIDEQQAILVDGVANILTVAPATNERGGDRPTDTRPALPASR